MLYTPVAPAKGGVPMEVINLLAPAVRLAFLQLTSHSFRFEILNFSSSVPYSMSSIVSNETVWQDAVSNQQPAQEDYAYLAYLKLEVPSPEADHTVVSRFIAAYLVQRAGYSPCSALQHASKFGLDGQSLYDAELATFQRRAQGN
ncbi:hypothetical protein XPA_009638 [Xanthoria parietina]